MPALSSGVLFFRLMAIDVYKNVIDIYINISKYMFTTHQRSTRTTAELLHPNQNVPLGGNLLRSMKSIGHLRTLGA